MLNNMLIMLFDPYAYDIIFNYTVISLIFHSVFFLYVALGAYAIVCTLINNFQKVSDYSYHRKKEIL